MPPATTWIQRLQPALRWPLVIAVIGAAVVGATARPTATFLGLGVILLAVVGVLVIDNPVRGILLLPYTTLLVPVFVSDLSVQLNLNLCLLVLLVVTVFQDRRVVLPRRYTELLLAISAVSAFATAQMTLEVSVAKGVLRFGYLGQWLLYLALPVVVIAHLDSLERPRRRQVRKITVAAIFTASGVVVAHLVGVYLNLLPPIAGGEKVTIIANSRRLRTFWRQGPNVVGLFLVLQTLLSGAFVASGTFRRRTRVVLGAYGMICLALLPFTYSRSAFVGLVVGCVVLAGAHVRRIIPPVTGLLLAGAVAAPASVRTRFVVRTFDWMYISPLGISLPVGAISKRFNFWLSQISVYDQHRILGSGFFITVTDSTYVNLFVGTGVVGLLLTVLLFVRFGRDCLGAAIRHRNASSSFDEGVSVAALAALVAFLAWSTFSDAFARWRVLGIVFLLVGLALESVWQQDGHGTDSQ